MGIIFQKGREKMNLQDVYSRIENNNISVFPFGIDKIKAVTIETDNRYGIFVNHEEIVDKNEEFCVLAHEYGHCKSGTTHKLNSSFSLICQHEYRADRQSIIDLLPVSKIQEAIQNGSQTLYEIAEFVDMPEAFVSKAIQHYTSMELI